MIHMLSFHDSVTFLKRASLCFYHQYGDYGKLFHMRTENHSTNISSTFCGHQKVFPLCIQHVAEGNGCISLFPQPLLQFVEWV